MHLLKRHDRGTDNSITPPIIQTKSVRFISYRVRSLQKGYLGDIADSIWRGITRHPWEVVRAPQRGRGTGKDVGRVLSCVHINRISRCGISEEEHGYTTHHQESPTQAGTPAAGRPCRPSCCERKRSCHR